MTAEAIDSAVASPADKQTRFKVGGRYAWYVLMVATLISTLSLLDRQVVSIVAGDLRTDLRLTNAEVGLLFGTVFGVFYAVFGIPLGRLADSWNRSRLLALAVAGWSAATLLSGLAFQPALFAMARSGVAVGEAMAAPAAYSLLSDWFPKSKRATVLAIYSCGISLGLGASLAIGGAVLGFWKSAFPAGAGLFGLHGWQAVFLVIGAPGLFVALWAATLREPPRGLSDGVIQPAHPQPLLAAFNELLAVLPLTSQWRLMRLGAGRRDVAIAIAAPFVICAAVAGLTMLTEALAKSPPPAIFNIGAVKVTSPGLEWATLGLGLAVTIAWVLSLKHSDRPTYALLWATREMVALTAASAGFMTITYGLTGWSALYAIEHFHASPSYVGLRFGAILGVTGLVSTYVGGWAADFALRFFQRGRLWVSLAGMVAVWPLAYLTFAAPTLNQFFISYAALGFATTIWLPGVSATCQGLVMPRMRGATAATYNLAVTMVGLGLGPFLVGLISDQTGSIATGILAIYGLSPLVWICMAIAIRGLPKAEATRLDRARAAGEPI